MHVDKKTYGIKVMLTNNGFVLNIITIAEEKILATALTVLMHIYIIFHKSCCYSLITSYFCFVKY